MRMAMSNFVGKVKLNFDDPRDLILVEDVRKFWFGIYLEC